MDDSAGSCDPDGIRPGISFLKVPEPKTAKNRLHLDHIVLADPEGNEFCVV